jgi:hypothetical protein
VNIAKVLSSIIDNGLNLTPKNYLNHGYQTHVTHKHRSKGGVLPIQETNKRKEKRRVKKVDKSVTRHETRTLRLLT